MANCLESLKWEATWRMESVKQIAREILIDKDFEAFKEIFKNANVIAERRS